MGKTNNGSLPFGKLVLDTIMATLGRQEKAFNSLVNELQELKALLAEPPQAISSMQVIGATSRQLWKILEGDKIPLDFILSKVNIKDLLARGLTKKDAFEIIRQWNERNG